MTFGIYIHFPYCLAKCPYCDFASSAVLEVPHQRYARAVARELNQRVEAKMDRQAGSIYIGGGTPSLWEPSALAEVLCAVERKVEWSPEAEATVEVNPSASDTSRLRALRALGLNRVSIGVQSWQPQVLRDLGRKHSASEAVMAVNRAREAGFANLALDLLYGASGQTLELALEDARRAVQMKPEHLSCYALTLENLAVDVPMAREVRAGKLVVPDADAQWEMGKAIDQVLSEAGYRHYEISNWTRPGFEARHNLLYWTGGEYLGLGCGACGFMLHEPSDASRGGRRWGNFRSPDAYLAAVEAGRLPEEWSEELDAATLLRELLTVGLRRLDGVQIEDACARLGQDPAKVIEASRVLVKRGLATLEKGVLALTERGLDHHSEVVLAFV